MGNEPRVPSLLHVVGSAVDLEGAEVLPLAL